MANPYYLDSDTALSAIKTKPKGPSLIGMDLPDFSGMVALKEAIPTQQATPVATPAPAPSQTSSTRKLISMELPDFSGLPDVAPLSGTPAKPKEEGFFTGLAKALSGGVQDTGASLYSAGATVVDAKGAVVDSAKAAAARSPDQALELQNFNAAIKRRQDADDSGLLAGIKNVANAAYENKEGFLQMVVSQLPNTAVALGSGFAGGAAGAAVGSVVPVIGTAIGGAVGFITGLFSANTVLEIGGKAQKAAADGNFTDAERYEAMQQGIVKGGVITAVDVATLGASKWILGTANRAVEAATIRTIEAAGYDATKLATTIKQSQVEALKATANQGREASTAALEKATFEAMVREGVTDPKLVSAIRNAQTTALEGVNTIARKAGRGTAAVGLETVGEGLGEYLGELAATGKASPTEAVLEALAGLSMSVTELGGLAKLEKPGQLTRATNVAGLRGLDPSGKIQSTKQELNQDITRLDDANLQRATIDIEGAFKRDTDQGTRKTLNVMTALYDQAPEGKEGDAIRQSLDRTASRAGVETAFNSLKGNSNAKNEGYSILSDAPQLGADFLTSAEIYGNTLPPMGRVKFPPKPQRTQEEIDAEYEAMFEAQGATVDNPLNANQTSIDVTPPDLTQIDVTQSIVPAQNQEVNQQADTQAQDVITTWDTIAPGQTITLYRGESQDQVRDGQWWTTDRSKAEKYGTVTEVSLPSETVGQNSARGQTADEFVFTSIRPTTLAKLPEAFTDVDKGVGTQTNRVADVGTAPQDVIAFHLTESNTRKGKEGVAPTDIQISEVPPFLQKIADAFGVKLNGYTTDKSTVKGFSDNNSNNIYINTAALTKIDGMFILGHEVWHQLENRNKALADELSASIVGYLKGNAYARYSKKLSDLGYSKSDIDSEITGDILGLMFNDGKFWQMVGQKNPNLLEAVRIAIDSILAKMKEMFGRADGLQKQITDVETVRDLLSSVAAELAQQKGTSGDQTASFMEDSENADPRMAEVNRLRKEGKTDQASKLKQQIEADAKTVRQANIDQEENDNETFRANDPLVQVESLLSQGNVGQASKVFRDNKLFETRGIDFASLMKKTKAAPKKAMIGTGRGKQLDELTKDKPVREAPASVDKPVVYSAPVEELRKKFNGVWKQSVQVPYLDETKRLIQQQINDLYGKLSSLNTMIVKNSNGTQTVFKLQDETDDNAGMWGYSDLNAYDRGTEGFVYDKPSTKQELLGRLRMLNDELETIRGKSSASKAALAKRSAARVADTFMGLSMQAIKDGANREEVNELLSNQMEIISALGVFESNQRRDRLARSQFKSEGFKESTATEAEVQNEIETAWNAAQDSPNASAPMTDEEALVKLIENVRGDKVSVSDASAVLNQVAAESNNPDKSTIVKRFLAGLVKDLPSVKDSQYDRRLDQITSWAAAASKDGLLRFDDFMDVFSMQGVDIPFAVTRNTQIAMRQLFTNYLSQNGNGYANRDAWMRSMDAVVRYSPGLLTNGSFTDAEIAGYQAWKESIASVAKRRQIGNKDSDTLADAFPNLLFIDHTLNEMRNPSTMSERDQVILSRNIPDLVDAYFADIAHALYFPTDFKDEVFDYISAAERIEFEKWIDNKSKAVDTDVNLSSRVPFLKELLGMRFIDDVTFERFRNKIIRSQLSDLRDITNAANEVNLLARNQSKSTGEIFERGTVESEQILSDYIDSIVMNGLMQDVVNTSTESDMDQFGAKVVEDMGFAETKEDTYNQLRDTKAEQGFASSESSSMSIEDMENSSRRQENLDDYSVGELYNILGEHPLSSTDGSPSVDESPLRRGLFSGVLTNKLVNAYVARITSKWKNAPQIVVLNSHFQLPAALRDRVTGMLTEGMGAKGLFDSATGVTYLFSDYLTGEADTQFTLFHEIYGHLGNRAFQGADFDQFLLNMYNANEVVRRTVDAAVAKGGVSKLQAIDEVLADMAADGTEVSAVTEWIGKTIAGLRSAGFNWLADFLGKMTSAELAYSLKMAKQHVENGGGYSPLKGAPRDIRLAEGRLPYELFATKGGNTTGYARYDPLNDTWYLFSNKNGDIRQKSFVNTFNSYEQLQQFMKRLGTIEQRVRSGFFRDNKIPADYVKFTKSREVSKLRGYWNATVNQFQNQYAPVFRVVEQMEKVGRVSDQIDLRTGSRLYERKAAVRIEDANREFVTPAMNFLKEARKQKFTQGYVSADGKIQGSTVDEMLNLFLVAQTAEERNIQVNRINLMSVKGSGMDTLIAREILEFVSKQSYAKQFNEIGKLLDAMSEKKINNDIATGLITKRDGEARRTAYQHYRNLGGINKEVDEDFMDDPSINVSTKFLNKATDKRAMGRSDIAQDVLARTFMGYEASIIRGEKNLFAQEILRFFETNYDPNFVSINEQSKIKKIGEDGFVQIVDNENYPRQDDVMFVRFKGIPITIRFKDTGEGSIAESLYGKNPIAQNRLMHAIGQITRFTGQLITTYNPLWIAVNFARDVQTLFFNSAVNGEVKTATAAQMMKELVPFMGVALHMAIMDMQPSSAPAKAAQKTLLALSRGTRWLATATTGKADRDRMAIYQEARSAGALTSFINRKDLEQQALMIHEALHGTSTLSKMHGMLKFMELLTIPMEMAPRLAAYSALTKNGSTSRQAADYAGRVTVDFNMRGNNEAVRALYLFFNPAVQGTAQMYELAKNNKGRFTVLAGSLMAMGFIIGTMTRAAGDSEDDEYKKKHGKNVLDDIPTYKRATSIIVAPNERWGAIPLPYGWNAFYAAGVFMSDSVKGPVPATTTAKRIMQAFFEAFSPVGGSGFDLTKVPSEPFKQAMAIFTPTVLITPMQYEMNKNRFGGPIYPELTGPNQEGRSDVNKAFASVNPISKDFTVWLQKVTGGDRFNQKGVDISPALIDHLIQGYTPGIANELYKAAGISVRKERGMDVPREKEPLADRFSAYPSESADAQSFRRVFKEATGLYNDAIKYELNDPRRKAIIAEHPELGQTVAILKSVDQSLSTMRRPSYQAEEQVDVLFRAGKTKEAEAMRKQVINYQNIEKEAERRLYAQATKAFTKSKFEGVAVSND